VLALGGIDAESILGLSGGPVPGVAAIRGLLDAADPEEAARRLRGWLDDNERGAS
jgi:thiamine monophosphate synthase